MIADARVSDYSGISAGIAPAMLAVGGSRGNYGKTAAAAYG